MTAAGRILSILATLTTIYIVVAGAPAVMSETFFRFGLYLPFAYATACLVAAASVVLLFRSVKAGKRTEYAISLAWAPFATIATWYALVWLVAWIIGAV